MITIAICQFFAAGYKVCITSGSALWKDLGFDITTVCNSKCIHSQILPKLHCTLASCGAVYCNRSCL